MSTKQSQKPHNHKQPNNHIITKMKWTDIDHSFCEASLRGLPEYYNAITSLSFALFGAYGLSKQNNELFIDILYANLIIVGFGSVGYHWYGNIGWGLFDEIPMILAIFTGIIYTENVYFLQSCSNVLLSQKTSHPFAITEISTHKKNRKLRVLAYLFSMSFFIIIDTMSNYRRVFPTLFASVAGYLYYRIIATLHLTNIHTQHQIKQKIYNSLFTVLISGAVWVTTEISCNYVKHRLFLIGHPIWHFFVGHGFYNLIQAVYFMKLQTSISNSSNSSNNITIRYRKPFYLLDICNCQPLFPVELHITDATTTFAPWKKCAYISAPR
jgi:hypothetical protein